MARSPQKHNKDELTERRILVGDDDAGVRDVLAQLLAGEGYHVITASSGQESLDLLTVEDEAKRPEIALLDIKMPGMDGITILQRMLEQGKDVPVILMTGYTTASLAIKAMQMGAADYLTKPFTELDEVLIAVERALRYEDLKRGVGVQLVPTSKTDPSERIVGSSPDMVKIFKTIGQVARTPATVLVTGETGTGKELMAEAIHNASDRRRGPLVKVNCAALPETLSESELFGHEKGSFTSAVAQRKGRFELAHGGTIFLDEIGEITLGMQKKLLRVLQEKEFERVGGTETVKVNVRVIAATNKDLSREVAEGRFREDLYYRLNVITIDMPPLRERGDDIILLTEHFLDKHRFSPGAPPARISEEAMARLVAHDWPGNVRELEHTIQRAVVLSRGKVITPEHLVLTPSIDEAAGRPEERRLSEATEALARGLTFAEAVAEFERELVAEAVRRANGDEAAAAAALGIDLATLRARLAPAPAGASGR